MLNLIANKRIAFVNNCLIALCDKRGASPFLKEYHQNRENFLDKKAVFQFIIVNSPHGSFYFFIYNPSLSLSQSACLNPNPLIYLSCIIFTTEQRYANNEMDFKLFNFVP